MSTAPLEPQDQQILDRAVSRFQAAKPRHDACRSQWEKWYARYRSYRDFRRDYASASRPRDVDAVLTSGKRAFRESLIIPYAFSIIETTLPRMLSNNPRMLVLPRATFDGDRAQTAENNVENVRLMIDVQQSAIDYNLILQDVAKSGLIYGLGVQKTWWDQKYRARKVLRRPTLREASGPEWVEGKVDNVLVYDGPCAEAIDVFDFLWDPTAHDMHGARFAIHRTWRDDAYVARMLETSQWKLPEKIDLEQVRGLGGSEERDTLWSQRDKASGYRAGDHKAEKLHEVWEVHDDGLVTVVLDRAVPVVHEPSPFWHGEMPFQVYRPTKVPHEMAGIGEIEAIEDLLDEMDELRTSRRDNARLALQRPFAYWDGMVDAGDIAFGPAVGIPVDGDPKEALFPLPLQDIPASGYQEEQMLQRDIERVSGVDDTISGAEGGGGASQTATGVQMVQAAANVRIQNKTKRIETEVVKHAAKQWVELNQQYIAKTRFIPGPPKPGEADRSWTWYEIGPDQLAGEYDVQPEGGSMAPENIMQKRNDAQLFASLLPVMQGLVDPSKAIPYLLELLGIDKPESWLAPQEPQYPAHVVEHVAEALRELAVQAPDQLEQLADPAFLQSLLTGAMAADEQPPGGPPQGQPPPDGGGPTQEPAEAPKSSGDSGY